MLINWNNNYHFESSNTNCLFLNDHQWIAKNSKMWLLQRKKDDRRSADTVFSVLGAHCILLCGRLPVGQCTQTLLSHYQVCFCKCIGSNILSSPFHLIKVHLLDVILVFLSLVVMKMQCQRESQWKQFFSFSIWVECALEKTCIVQLLIDQSGRQWCAPWGLHIPRHIIRPTVIFVLILITFCKSISSFPNQ